MAQAIKKGYDSRYPSSGLATDGVYHVLVGKHFGASFSHETHQYIHLKVDLNDVIIFKSKDSPFDFDQVCGLERRVCESRVCDIAMMIK